MTTHAEFELHRIGPHEDDDEPDPGSLPVDPDNGPVPVEIPDDPERERVREPES